ncbi:MAG: hypothetical protein J6X61_02440 [Clostridia bacterium]|nr:hypothetical protein [Clostridia bacterium]
MDMKKDGMVSLSLGTLLRGILYHVMCLLATLGILSVVSGQLGAFLAEIPALILVTVLPYRTFYQAGFRDYNKLQYEQIRRDPLKGLKAALIGYCPFILASVAVVLARVGVLPEGYLPFYRLINAPFLPLMQSLIPTGLTFAEVPVAQVVLAALTCLVLPLAAGLGYRLGLDRVPSPFERKKKGR